MANSVTVQFLGICTHMMNTLPKGRRVVLPDASDAATLSNNFWFHEHTVDPHLARLQLRIEDIVTMSASEMSPGLIGFTAYAQSVDTSVIVWNLNAITLSIPNEDPSSFATITPSPIPLPSLSKLTPGLGPASPLVTVDQIPTMAAAFFDVITGAWGTVAMKKAFVATVDVQTLGTPTLRVGSFTSGEHVTIYLKTGAIVSVSNLEEDKVEGDTADFALHYLTAQSFPGTPGINTEAPPSGTRQVTTNIPISLLDDGPGGITPSCSNSVYP